ncbi:MAG: mercuric reductase [Chloroflexota bacterium]
MTDTREYDAIIIGSGQGGGPLSTALAGQNRTVALIEREHVGGTCINDGCTPTKTMIASARVAHMAAESQRYGVETGPVTVHMPAVRQRKRDLVEMFRTGSQKSIEAGNVDLIFGEARFTGPKTLEVALRDGGTRELSADLIVIDTGTRPTIPKLPGLDGTPYLTSTTIMEINEVPEHLLVLGGGYVGLEFSQMFRRFGSKVTVIQLDTTLMGREDTDVADAVATILREDGIDILLETAATDVKQGDNGTIQLSVRTPDGNRTLTGSHLLVAVGRTPNTEALNLTAAGVETTERGFVRVNGRLETNVPGVYALGDVAGSPAFTHISYDDFRILRANLLEGGHRSTAHRLIPYTMFTDPQLGRVGLGEDEARAQGRNIQVATMPMSHVARAIEVDEQRGMMKAVVDADTGQILGCAVLGIEGGELMAMLEIAMMGNLPYTALRDGIFAHPTLAESFNNLFGTLSS